jgi:hypothetical protein
VARQEVDADSEDADPEDAEHTCLMRKLELSEACDRADFKYVWSGQRNNAKSHLEK